MEKTRFADPWFADDGDHLSLTSSGRRERGGHRSDLFLSADEAGKEMRRRVIETARSRPRPNRRVQWNRWPLGIECYSVDGCKAPETMCQRERRFGCTDLHPSQSGQPRRVTQAMAEDAGRQQRLVARAHDDFT